MSDRELACLGRKHLYEIGEGRANSFEEEIPPRPSSNKEKKSKLGVENKAEKKLIFLALRLYTTRVGG